MAEIYINGEYVEQDRWMVDGPSAYEVIRVKDGFPRFFEQHVERMMHSIDVLGIPAKTSLSEELRGILEQLIRRNEISNQNIRVDYTQEHFVVQPIASYYPSEAMYSYGVDVVTMEYERDNPNAKVANASLTERALEVRKIENAFEVLLVGERGYITEGSRSNLFFIAEDTIYTAPLDEVLGGVTRSILMRIIKNQFPEYKLVEASVHITELYKYEACFLTGTSIELLPIRRINSQLYSVNNEVFQKLADRFKGVAELAKVELAKTESLKSESSKVELAKRNR